MNNIVYFWDYPPHASSVLRPYRALVVESTGTHEGQHFPHDKLVVFDYDRGVRFADGDASEYQKEHGYTETAEAAPEPATNATASTQTLLDGLTHEQIGQLKKALGV
jgi:hypothetical protein